MAILYVTEQGASIRHIAGRIIVRRENRIIQEWPDFKVEQIVAFGNVQVTPQTMDYCFQQGIDVSFLSSTGRYRGRLQANLTKNAALRQRQYERRTDAEFCRTNAAAIVIGKIRNMAVMVRRQRRLRDDGRSPIADLEGLIPKVAAAANHDSLYGFEGTASAAYFGAFRAALRGDWKFEARQYHPPPDEVNALLSFGYTLLHNDLFAAINIVGLDPFMGFFHQPRLGHAALASDLMEEHRCVVVDRLVLTMLNKRIISDKDFVATPHQGFRLVPEALKRFLGLYARQTAEVVSYPAKGIQTSYRKVMEQQVRQFARVLIGEEPVYKPYLFTDEPLQNDGR